MFTLILLLLLTAIPAIAADLPETIIIEDIDQRMFEFKPASSLQTREHSECFQKAPLFAYISQASTEPIQIPITASDFYKFVEFCKRKSEGYSSALEDAFKYSDTAMAVLTALDFPLYELPAQQELAVETKKRKPESAPEQIQPIKQPRIDYQQKTSIIFKNGLSLVAYDHFSEFLRSIPDSVIQNMTDFYNDPKDLKVSLIDAELNISKETAEFLSKYLSFLETNKGQPSSKFRGESDVTLLRLLGTFSWETKKQILEETILFADFMNFAQMEELLETHLLFTKTKRFINALKQKIEENPNYSLINNIDLLIPHDKQDLTELVKILETANSIVRALQKKEKKSVPANLSSQIFWALQKHKPIYFLQKAVQYKSDAFFDKFAEDIKKSSNATQVRISIIIDIFYEQLDLARNNRLIDYEGNLFDLFANATNRYPEIVAAAIVMQCKNSADTIINLPFVEYSLRKFIPMDYRPFRELIDALFELLLKTYCHQKNVDMLQKDLKIDYSVTKDSQTKKLKLNYSKNIEELPGYKVQSFEAIVDNISLTPLVNAQNRITDPNQATTIFMGKYSQDFQ